MMLLPIMLNDKTIGAIYARRLQRLSGNRKVYDYEWEVTLEGGPAPSHQTGYVEHAYSDGALVLVKKILDKVDL